MLVKKEQVQDKNSRHYGRSFNMYEFNSCDEAMDFLRQYRADDVWSCFESGGAYYVCVFIL